MPCHEMSHAMPSSSMQLPSSSPAVWRSLGAAESQLVAYAKQQHEKSIGRQVLGGDLAALKGSKGYCQLGLTAYPPVGE